MAGDTHILCSRCHLPIILGEGGDLDPETEMHKACRIKGGRTRTPEDTAKSLALDTGELIRGSGITAAIKAWDDAVDTRRHGQAKLRDFVQRVIIVLLVKGDARHAALLGELETLFGKFPEPVRAAS